MWDALFARRTFYNKCKSALRMINARMEMITKKRSAMQKFLKNDVAELLRGNLDQKAYGRAQGLYMEMNLTWCYNYVQECCTLVTDNLKLMQTELECPEECKVAVASLAYAAARFADLPELRDLRSLFTEKYGGTLDSYVNKEFAEKLKSNPPMKEGTIKLMKDIAEEFSIPWNPAFYEQHLKGNGVYQKAAYEQPWAYKASGYKENDRTQENVFYKQVSSFKDADTSGYREVDQVRPYTSNRVVNAPYVKLKSNKEGEGEESDSEKALMDKVLKTWRKPTIGDRAHDGTGTGTGTGTSGRSSSMYMHPNLPDCDELASRIQALKKM